LFGFVEWDSALGLLFEFLFAVVVFVVIFLVVRRVERKRVDEESREKPLDDAK